MLPRHVLVLHNSLDGELLIVILTIGGNFEHSSLPFLVQYFVVESLRVCVTPYVEEKNNMTN